MNAAYAYAMVLLTVTLTVYGQFVIKWQALRAGPLPLETRDQAIFLLKLLLNPWVLSALLAAFLASIAWMLAMTKLDISRAFPLTALTFICVVVGGAIFFKEPLTLMKIVGVALLALGILATSQG
ncbi:EamA-like transporter family protein [Luteimonas cucumeris]|uniref:EamA-like transporter family protein n=1 Tax=Luteimonas cucumeris TaxID=985012 RepID=A0A562L5R6_9GAMM|nr:EamA family transporter [Luteimonas cucumeris]TWI02971.1 EamA-like transporter family protein [Luteimonas cucumeris]